MCANTVREYKGTGDTSVFVYALHGVAGSTLALSAKLPVSMLAVMTSCLMSAVMVKDMHRACSVRAASDWASQDPT